MEKSLVLSIVGPAIFLLIVGQVTAGLAVSDQYLYQSSGGTNLTPTRYLGQTFTCGIEGQLSYVSLEIDVWSQEPPFFPVTVSIVETQNGIPSGSVLGSVTVNPPALGWFKFDFSQESVDLLAGTQYAIVAYNNDNISGDPSDGVRIQFDNNLYAGGRLWQWKPTTGWQPYVSPIPDTISSDIDMAFQTWMVPIPEPTTLLLFGLGGLVLRKRCK